ncbi:MAG: M67 family metallopeptidase [Cyanobacteria bacterium P01_F01_bin.56]
MQPELLRNLLGGTLEHDENLTTIIVTLILQQIQMQAMAAHAEQTYPEECCGLLLGIFDVVNDCAQVQEVQPVHNTWTEAVNPFVEGDRQTQSVSKRNRFWIDPSILLAAQRECRDRGWTVLGFYHSHPDHPAVPSARDQQLAWSGYAYPILSVTAQQVTAVQSWRLNDHGQFTVEMIQIR